MTIDYKDFNKKLEAMSGQDFEEAVSYARAEMDNSVLAYSSTKVHAHLAAKALEISVDELRKMPLSQFATVTGSVANFLLLGSAQEIQPEKKTQLKKSEK